jgi:glycosyltransferase involved in cell wall biosynthesis
VLAFAIRSILRQDFRDWELIVVGDHCTEATGELVASFADPRMRYVSLAINYSPIARLDRDARAPSVRGFAARPLCGGAGGEQIEIKVPDRRRAKGNPAAAGSLSQSRPSRRKISCHSQRTALVGFKGDFLRQHDVACDEIISGHKTPARCRIARVVQLVDIGGCAMADSIPLSAMAADDIEISMRVILCKLLWREPLPQQPETARFAVIFMS